jgi:hypothetical protein
MTWDDVFWHLVNFGLPAVVLSLGITLWGSFQLAVLVGGLVMTGHDGKMATYAALVLVCATLEWALQLRFKLRG